MSSESQLRKLSVKIEEEINAANRVGDIPREQYWWGVEDTVNFFQWSLRQPEYRKIEKE